MTGELACGRAMGDLASGGGVSSSGIPSYGQKRSVAANVRLHFLQARVAAEEPTPLEPGAGKALRFGPVEREVIERVRDPEEVADLVQVVGRALKVKGSAAGTAPA